MLNNNSIKQKINISRNHWILFFIVFVGALLRLIDMSYHTFSHDELSALIRTDFSSFNDLIEYGVKTDFHPAGIQVFLYYWVHFFGKAEWIVKLPFILASIASIYLMFQIGKKWKNETVGLLCAAFIASTQYSVMYGTSARPYASGLFFILVLINALINLITNKDSKKLLRSWIIFIVAGTCAAYNHHYSLLIAGIIGITGLFFIPKQLRLRYIASGIIILLLYMPHIPLLLFQLSKGGVGGADGWLAAPTPYFFIDYFNYLFHFSIWPVLVTLGIIIYGFFNSDVSKRTIGLMSLAFILFLLPILIGYFYSVYKNPILQFSVIIFSHFFFYLLIFGHFKSLSSRKNAVLVIAILTVNILTLTIHRKHYSVNTQSIYEHATLDLIQTRNAHPNTPAMIECSPSILAFYDKQKSSPPVYVKYRDFENNSSRLKYIDSVSAVSNYFYFASTSFVDPVFVALIQTRFPQIVWQKNYFSGSTILYSKQISKSSNSVISRYSDGKWSDGENKLPQTKEGFFIVDSLMEFGPNFKIPIKDILKSPSDNIDILVKFNSLSSNSDVKIVAQIELPDTLLQWGASASNEQQINSICSEMVHSLSIHNPRYFEKATIVIYLWNPNKLNFEFKDMEITRRKGNPLVFGLFQEIR